MPFQVSPGVLVKEVDLTNVVPAVSTSIGAIAGNFEKVNPSYGNYGSIFGRRTSQNLW